MDEQDPTASPAGFGRMHRRAFVGASAAAGGAAAMMALIPGCSRTGDEPAGAVPDVESTVRLQINGRGHDLTIDNRTSLLDMLREHVALPGTKKGCDQGACGACTVLIDEQRMLSCMTLAVMVDGTDVTTIEGLANGEDLHPMQQAFIDEDGFQCGFCTPGQILSGIGCISEGHASSPEEIREWMSGNICRCGAYNKIVAAVARTAETGD